jgi:hypothetical protein
MLSLKDTLELLDKFQPGFSFGNDGLNGGGEVPNAESIFGSDRFNFQR